MDDRVSITVPLGDKRALAAAGQFFNTLADDEMLSMGEPPNGVASQVLDQAAATAELQEPGALGVAVETEQPPPVAVEIQGAAPTVVPAGALINEAGVPWHADFHAGTKTKTADGHWKAKRGVDKKALAAYEAQFTAVAPGAAAAPGAVAPGAVAAPSVPGTVAPGAVAAPGVPGTVAPGAVAAPGVPGVPGAAVAPANFAEVMAGLIPKQQAGLITPAEVTASLAAVGLAQITDLNVRADLIPTVWAALEEIWNQRTPQ
jgi:hypothetical protein